MSHAAKPANLIGQYDPPTLGVNVMLPAHKLNERMLVDALNVMTRAGVLRTRPGYTGFGSGTISGVPTGLTSYTQSAELGGRTFPIVATTSRVYAIDNGTVRDLTGDVALSADLLNQTRFATMSTGTPLVNYLLLANGVDPTQVWTGDLNGQFGPAIGNPPVFSDLCNIEDRIIGIGPDGELRWCDLTDTTSWPEDNVNARAGSTPDKHVCLTPIGQGTAAVLYKRQSLWDVNRNPAVNTEASAFTVRFRGFYTGPAGPAAVVPVDGGHVYMTNTGRIALFTGVQHFWIGDGVWPLLRARLNSNEAVRIFGVYDPVNHEVYFVFPDKDNADLMTGLAVVTLPNPQAGNEDTGVFPGRLTHEMTAGGVVENDGTRLDQLLLAGPNGAAGRVVEFTTDQRADLGAGFAGYWQTGLSLNAGDVARAEGLELFADRGVGYGALTVHPVTSYSLSGNGVVGLGLIGEAGNLERVDEPVRPITGFDARAKFWGARFAFDSSANLILRYKGALLYRQPKPGS